MATATGKDARVVVVGAGQAAADCAAGLRMAGHTGPITVLGDEEALPYTRPPLSKGYLSGKVAIEGLHILPPGTYQSKDIDVRLGCRVTSIDREQRLVHTAADQTHRYDWLVLATGGRARPLPDKYNPDAVHTIRGLADIDALRPHFSPGARMVVIGGGYVGLEVAAVARKTGLEVTVLEVAERVLARVTAPVISSFFERIHREEGVDLRTGVTLQQVQLGDDGRATGVAVDDEVLPADLVVAGIGQVPNTELADAAGLSVDDGIVVDEFCRTADPAVLAIGDCTRHPCAQRGGLRRLESVPNATEQARVAVSVIVGSPRPYEAVPWFWSDQYDVKLQTVGLSADHTEVVVRGDTDTGRSFAAFYLRDGHLVAADVVNRPRDFAAAKKLISTAAEVTPEALRDETTPLKPTRV